MSPYISLAKQTIEEYIKEAKIISIPSDLPKEFYKRKAGIFVTILKDKELRGCIGTSLPTKENIAKEIIDNAVAAATQDYRFGQITEEELPHLSYNVSVLSSPVLIKDIGNLNPKKYGIIVKSELKSGLLLPDLDGVDTIEHQIAIAGQKADIDLSTEKIDIYMFTVKKYE